MHPLQIVYLPKGTPDKPGRYGHNWHTQWGGAALVQRGASVPLIRGLRETQGRIPM